VSSAQTLTFTDVAEELWPRLYRTAVGLCRNAEDAQDLVQETLIQAFRKWDQFEGRSDPATWMYTIAARLCRRRHRRRAGAPRRLEPLADLLPPADGALVDLSRLGDPHDALARDELRRTVLDGIAGLPPAFRVPIVLVDIAELRTADVARILGIKEATVKTRVHRARLKLRQLLAAHLPSAPPVTCRHDRRVCLDLLDAKQQALDRGVPFSLSDAELCARCKSVMATLDLGKEVCRAIGRQTAVPPRRPHHAGAPATAPSASGVHDVNGPSTCTTRRP
jgi:RNA polymerase sigma-70 factor (ECF subfamily)